MINVAGGADALSDDDAVFLAGPRGGFTSGEPIASLGHESIAKRGAIGDVLEEASEAVGSAENIRVTMGEGDVCFDRLAMIAKREGCEERGDGGKAADVFIRDAAFEDVFAPSVAGEEGPVVFLEVGVAMPARGAHQRDILLRPGGGDHSCRFVKLAHKEHGRA